VEVVVRQLAPLRLDLALYLLPVAFHTIPVHWQSPTSCCVEPHRVARGYMHALGPRPGRCAGGWERNPPTSGGPSAAQARDRIRNDAIYRSHEPVPKRTVDTRCRASRRKADPRQEEEP